MITDQCVRHMMGRLYGAVEKTRTSTPVKEQRPQRCASTNSATTAKCNWYCLAKSLGNVKGPNFLFVKLELDQASVDFLV